MDTKPLVVILLISAIGALTAQDEEICNNVAPQKRSECGWFGIDEDMCLARNCCWDDTIPDAKYCFVKPGTNLPDGLCPVAPSERVECGYPTITKEECLSRTCCWDPTVQDALWCFHEPDLDPLGCYIYHGVYGNCHYVCDPTKSKMYGMGQCQGRICCYEGYKK